MPTAGRPRRAAVVAGCSACLLLASLGGLSTARSLLAPKPLSLSLSAATLPAGGYRSATAALDVIPALADRDGDGLPDVVTLDSKSDRRAFLGWFAAIAEAEFYRARPNPAWVEDQHDCAGLLRFAFREALKAHGPHWRAAARLPFPVVLPDVAKYRYPRVPGIGVRLFRIRPGAFAPTDLEDGTFAEYAEAKLLRAYNSTFLGRDRHVARRGDLLFFRHEMQARMPYHAMVYLGADLAEEGRAGQDWIVYHTGPFDDTRGEVRKVRFTTLARHPDPAWRPLSSNPDFLGYYRWNIVR